MQNKIILTLVLIAVIAGVHFSGEIKKTDIKGFSEQKLVLLAAITQELRTQLLEQILALLKLILSLQQQLNALVAKQQEAPVAEVDSTISPQEVVAVTPIPEEEGVSMPEEVEAPTDDIEQAEEIGPFESTLKIEVTFPSYTLGSYGEKVLNEFRLLADEKIAITKIRFKNSGDLSNSPTLKDAHLVVIKLINSNTNAVLAEVDSPTDKVIEFEMTPDESKADKGLMVSGNTYHILATILTPNYGIYIPHIRLDIESVSDISAFDYNDLSREADISKSISFPVMGPTITMF